MKTIDDLLPSLKSLSLILENIDFIEKKKFCACIPQASTVGFWRGEWTGKHHHQYQNWPAPLSSMQYGTGDPDYQGSFHPSS
jgi:hypothetical protein